MKSFRVTILSVLVLVAATTVLGKSVKSDYDKEFDFSKLRTFAFKTERSANDLLNSNAIEAERLQSALTAQLQKAKAVLIGAIPPVMVKSDKNPGGTPIEEFNKLRAAVVADRSQFWKDLSLPFYGYNRPGAQSLGRCARIILAAGNDVWLSRLLFLYQSVLRNRSD